MTVTLRLPDHDLPFVPAGSERTLDDGIAVCVSEQLLPVTYTNGPRTREQSALFERQLDVAHGPEESLAALLRAAERGDRA
ncbi:hypothetical protein AQJ11_37700 [Streptomyces corchorusii]|uniref:DUF5753 domain-containing protein n=2 Tax=Streptomyces TaxID=1883 RepID=A0A101PTZ1_STRCK|nr:hypothetical protein [Streptomyces corchorusii]KUN17601.1 hypothetical protein AQJ11_37700 [Streptomyces corchorusii]